MEHSSKHAPKFIFLLLILHSVWALADQIKFDPDDQSALLELKAKFPTVSYFFDWDSGANPCTWNYIFCNAEGQVTQIAMSASFESMSGQVPWEILRKIKHLKKIDFSGQNFSGEAFPETIGEMNNLEAINFRYNSLDGAIPPSFIKLQNLSQLDLTENNVHGDLNIFSNLKNLDSLLLRQNNFSGSLPDFGGMQKLNRLDLSGNALTGTVPPSLGSLKHLTELALEKNLLSGKISNIVSELSSLISLDVSNNEFLDSFPSIQYIPNLQYLDLSYNSFYGPIPSDVFKSPALSIIMINDNYFNGHAPVDTNKRDSGSFVIYRNCFKGIDSSSERCKNFQKKTNSKYRAWMLAVLIFTSIILLITFALILKSMCWKRMNVNGVELSTKTIRHLNLDEVKFATSNFKERIGGDADLYTVFRGILKDAKPVAIKRMHEHARYCHDEFKHLVNGLFDFSHKDVLALIGYSDQNEQIFVYEYPVIGTIAEYLHGDRASEFPLSWNIRMKISIHVAMAMEFVHNSKIRSAIPREIKSSNVLLCADGYAKIADFSVDEFKNNEKIMNDDGNNNNNNNHNNMNKIKNNEKDDVYDFGKFLFELITGMQSFPKNIDASIMNREQFANLVDTNLKGDFNLNELMTISEMIMKCIKDDAIARPSARDVVQTLNQKLGKSLFARIMDETLVDIDEENVNGNNFINTLKINLKNEIKYRPMNNGLHKPLVK